MIHHIYFVIIFFYIYYFTCHCSRQIEMDDGDVCLAGCATTHTILRDKRYFLSLTLTSGNVSTISGTSNLIEGSGRANIMLLKGTRFHINDALYILANPQEIYLVLKIFIEMDIILKP